MKKILPSILFASGLIMIPGTQAETKQKQTNISKQIDETKDLVINLVSGEYIDIQNGFDGKEKFINGVLKQDIIIDLDTQVQFSKSDLHNNIIPVDIKLEKGNLRLYYGILEENGIKKLYLIKNQPDQQPLVEIINLENISSKENTIINFITSGKGGYDIDIGNLQLNIQIKWNK